MRHAVVILALITVGVIPAGCALSEGTGQVAPATLRARPGIEKSTTGSMLPAHHRIGALPVDVYGAQALHQQGVTSAAGAVMQIPQNNNR